MKASVIESPQAIVIKEASLPYINDEDVLVKLEGTGVCASNLPVWEGRDWFKYPFEPGAPGHEGYGVVTDLGYKVTDISIGDKVALISSHAYAEYDKAHVSEIVKIPHTLNTIPFPGEPLACAVNILNRSDIQEGQKVLVIGAGFIGCLLIQLLKNAGAEVIVVSRRLTSLDFAKIAGADHLIRFADYYHTVNQINCLAPEGIPRIIEATGAQKAIDLATEVISVRGKLVIAGYHQDGTRNINMQIWNWKGIDIINAHERDPLKYTEGLKNAIQLCELNILQPHKFITHYVDFENINYAFRLLKDRPETFLKAMIMY